MANRKGQITIFIILGIVIIASVSLLLYFRSVSTNDSNSEIEKIFETSTDAIPIKTFVESCLGNVADDGIIYTSLRGGYYIVADGVEQPFMKIPYYFYLGSEDVPTTSEIEAEISKYVSSEIDKCLNDFTSFKEIGYKIETDDKTVKTNLGKSVSIRLEYPIKVTKGESTTTITDFHYNINFNFAKLYNIIFDFATEHQKNPDFVPIGHLSFLAQKNNMTYNLIYTNDNEVIYSFIFNDLFDYNETLLFNFAAKYNWSDLSTSQIIDINPIEPQSAYVGYEFEYQVTGNGDNIKFSDFSYLFDINEDSGLIKFTPTERDIGTHNIIIKAYDDEGAETSDIMQLEVVRENFVPIIEEIADVKLKIGETFNTIIKARDLDEDSIMFLVESALPELKANVLTGQIQFTPKEGDEGIYTINVIAIDSNSGISKSSFRMEITNE